MLPDSETYVDDDRPRSTPPEPPPRWNFLERQTTHQDMTNTQSNDWQQPRFDDQQQPTHEPPALGTRWPSSPALGAHAHTRHTSGSVADDAPALFLKRVVVAGDEYDDVIDDMSAYGLKRSK